MHTKLWRTDEGMHYEKCSFVLLLDVISKLSIYQFRFYCLLRLLISTNETDAILVKKQLTQRWQRWWNQRSFVNVEPKHVDGSVLERRFFVKVARDPSAIWPFTTEIRQLISELPLSGRFHTRDGLSVWDGLFVSSIDSANKLWIREKKGLFWPISVDKTRSRDFVSSKMTNPLTEYWKWTIYLQFKHQR